MNTEETYSKLLEASKSSLVTECRKYANTTEDSLDLYQRVCVKMWKSFHTYNPAYSFVTWGSAVVRTVFIDRERRRRLPVVYTSEELYDTVITEREPIYYDYLCELTKEEAQFLTDYYITGLTFKEIAALRGLSYNTARDSVRAAFAQAQKVVGKCS